MPRFVHCNYEFVLIGWARLPLETYHYCFSVFDRVSFQSIGYTTTDIRKAEPYVCVGQESVFCGTFESSACSMKS